MNTKHRIPLLVAGLTLLAAILVVNTTGATSGITTITRVSVDSSGVQGNGYSYNPSISADGRYVAFESYANNLVSASGNGNNPQDILVHDTQTGATTPVSVDSSGVRGNNYSSCPAISADGRYVAFESYSNNLISGDTNGWPDIFLHDMLTGMTTRVSVDSSGGQGNDSSNCPSISADGRYVAFSSYARNLISGDTNNTSDIFVHDTQTGATSRISVDSSGAQANNSSYGQSISADGRYVAFGSNADNLISGDRNGYNNDIFLHDTQTGATSLISVDSSGAQGNSYSYEPSITPDGRYVAFCSDADNLVSGDSNGYVDVFVHDIQSGTTTLVSVDSGGEQGNENSTSASISSDGRYVAFSSYASNLVGGDFEHHNDIFIHDTLTGVTARLSVNSNGMQGNNYSSDPSISADGLFVAFYSYASNLVSDDTNGVSDVFITPATIFNLTVNKTGPGSGLVFTNLSSPAGISCGSVCSYDFVSGTTISLSAIPDTSSDLFAGWGGDVTGMDNPAIFIINKNMLITANFVNAWKVYLPQLIR